MAAPGRTRLGPQGAGPPGSPQEREILSGGMNPVSPRALSAPRPPGRTTRWLMLLSLRERWSQTSGGGGGKRQRPAHHVADDVGVAAADHVTVLLLLGVCPVDVVPEGGLDPGPGCVILHSLGLPVGHGRVGLDGGAFPPPQVCADLGDAWQVFADGQQWCRWPGSWTNGQFY